MSTISFTRPIVISDPTAVKKLKDIVYGEEEEEEDDNRRSMEQKEDGSDDDRKRFYRNYTRGII